MSRLTAIAAAALLSLVGTAGASGASARVFRVVPDSASFRVVETTEVPASLPSAETPNAPGSLLLPPSYLERRESQGLPFATLSALWRRAGAAYGIPWQVLAAINKIESNFGRNMGPSSAGAIGWMQFMPSTWDRWGTDADGDGLADPWNATDAIFSAARYLAAAGGRDDLYRGVFAYNHADWYVQDVLQLARLYGQGTGVAFSLDRVQVAVEAARKAVSKANRRLVSSIQGERRLAAGVRSADRRVQTARLLSSRLVLEKEAFAADSRLVAARRRVTAARRALKKAEQTLAEARATAFTSSFAPGAATLVASPLFDGDYVFPVGGGPQHVSVGHDHHDYPAADIAAPAGAPLYALTHGFVEDAWHMPSGACGIGFTLRAGDGRAWTYCHLSYLEPGVQAGAALTAGVSVGLVGSTGHSTGPHLHLQLQPAASYPQAEGWFAGFAGRAFRWQDAVTPILDAAPVFSVVDAPAGENGVVGFTRQS